MLLNVYFGEKSKINYCPFLVLHISIVFLILFMFIKRRKDLMKKVNLLLHFYFHVLRKWSLLFSVVSMEGWLHSIIFLIRCI